METKGSKDKRERAQKKRPTSHRWLLQLSAADGVDIAKVKATVEATGANVKRAHRTDGGLAVDLFCASDGTELAAVHGIARACARRDAVKFRPPEHKYFRYDATRKVTEDKFARRPGVYLRRVKERRHIYEILLAKPGFRDKESFVVAPYELGARVLGLVDAEYGWPKAVRASEIDSVKKMQPNYRAHPFVVDDLRHTLAVCIQIDEYRSIVRKLDKS